MVKQQNEKVKKQITKMHEDVQKQIDGREEEEDTFSESGNGEPVDQQPEVKSQVTVKSEQKVSPVKTTPKKVTQIQTVGNLNEIIDEHPEELAQNVEINYSPVPF